MPLFHASATIFTVNEKQLARSINEFQITEMMAAMRAFLKACIPRIPVRTGFLRSAFKPMRNFFQQGSGAELDPGLAALFGADPKLTKSRIEHFQGTDSRGKPLSEAGKSARERAFERELRKNLRRYRKNKKNKNAKDLRHTEYYYYGKGQRVAKTTSNALQFVIPKDPGEILSGKGLTTQLKFDVQISYYRINDFYSRIRGAPWRSLDAGFQASLNYLESAARRFPLISEVLVTQRIYLRGSRVTKETVGQDNQVADYRRRFGSTFYPSSGPTIPEGNIRQFPAPSEDNFGSGFPGLA